MIELNSPILTIIATPDKSPLIYIHRPIPFDELTALYYIADVCLLTSRRDGMNLVAFEYVACQAERHGVLALSELAGAASFMGPGSVPFHPSSEKALAQAIYTAVTMDAKERRWKYEYLRDFVNTHTRFVPFFMWVGGLFWWCFADLLT